MERQTVRQTERQTERKPRTKWRVKLTDKLRDKRDIKRTGLMFVKKSERVRRKIPLVHSNSRTPVPLKHPVC